MDSRVVVYGGGTYRIHKIPLHSSMQQAANSKQHDCRRNHIHENHCRKSRSRQDTQNLRPLTPGIEPCTLDPSFVPFTLCHMLETLNTKLSAPNPLDRWRSWRRGFDVCVGRWRASAGARAGTERGDARKRAGLSAMYTCRDSLAWNAKKDSRNASSCAEGGLQNIGHPGTTTLLHRKLSLLAALEIYQLFLGRWRWRTSLLPRRVVSMGGAVMGCNSFSTSLAPQTSTRVDAAFVSGREGMAKRPLLRRGFVRYEGHGVQPLLLAFPSIPPVGWVIFRSAALITAAAAPREKKWFCFSRQRVQPISKQFWSRLDQSQNYSSFHLFQRKNVYHHS